MAYKHLVQPPEAQITAKLTADYDRRPAVLSGFQAQITAKLTADYDCASLRLGAVEIRHTSLPS